MRGQATTQTHWINSAAGASRRRRRNLLPEVTGETSTTRCRVAPAQTSPRCREGDPRSLGLPHYDEHYAPTLPGICCHPLSRRSHGLLGLFCSRQVGVFTFSGPLAFFALEIESHVCVTFTLLNGHAKNKTNRKGHPTSPSSGVNLAC